MGLQNTTIGPEGPRALDLFQQAGRFSLNNMK